MLLRAGEAPVLNALHVVVPVPQGDLLRQGGLRPDRDDVDGVVWTGGGGVKALQVCELLQDTPAPAIKGARAVTIQNSPNDFNNVLEGNAVGHAKAQATLVAENVGVAEARRVELSDVKVPPVVAKEDDIVRAMVRRGVVVGNKVGGRQAAGDEKRARRSRRTAGIASSPSARRSR